MTFDEWYGKGSQEWKDTCRAAWAAGRASLEIETPRPEPVAYRWKWDKNLEWHYGEYLGQRDYYASEPLYALRAPQKGIAK